MDYLRETAYPVIKGAAEFWLDFLHTDPRDGTLVVSPSYSPEHGDFSAGASMSQQIVREVFTNALAAAKKLGVDKVLQAEVKAAPAKLDPGIRIGSWCQVTRYLAVCHPKWPESWPVPVEWPTSPAVPLNQAKASAPAEECQRSHRRTASFDVV